MENSNMSLKDALARIRGLEQELVVWKFLETTLEENFMSNGLSGPIKVILDDDGNKVPTEKVESVINKINELEFEIQKELDSFLTKSIKVE